MTHPCPDHYCNWTSPYQDDVFPPEIAYTDEAPTEYEETYSEDWWYGDWETDYPEYFDVRSSDTEQTLGMVTHQKPQGGDLE